MSLLTNDTEMEVKDIIEIYRKRWLIELLFKQFKQNFQLRYFYGESANAIKIQIWVTLTTNLQLMVIQRRIKRSWSFSGLATMFRIFFFFSLGQDSAIQRATFTIPRTITLRIGGLTFSVLADNNKKEKEQATVHI